MTTELDASVRTPADAPDPARADDEVQAWVGVVLDAGFGEVVAEQGYVMHWNEAVENANPIYWDEDLAGFGVRVQGVSKPVYLVRYRHEGRLRRMTVADVGAVTPAQARNEAKRLLGDQARGIDPLREREVARVRGVLMTELFQRYLDHHANKFTGQFDPNCYLYLSRASDLFDVSEHGSSVQAGLSKLRVKRALIIGVTTDFLFPIHQQRELAEGLASPGREIEFVALNSLQGHDSFLVDMDSYRPLIANFFA